MDKIKQAQTLADMLLDECSCQVGKDKAALPDEPEDVESSMDDLEDYLTTENETTVPTNEDTSSVSVAKVAAAMKEAEKNKTPSANNAVIEGLADWVRKKREKVQGGQEKGGLLGSISKRQKALNDAMKG